MKSFLFWIAERVDSVSVRLEILAEWIREKAADRDLSMPYYPEGPEGDA